jgi:hypothetical protein
VAEAVHQSRSIRYIGREDVGDWRLKVYGIGTHAPDARPEFVAATLDAAREALPAGGGAGFVIAHDAKAAGLSLVYWWANENEVHGRFFASPLDDPSAFEAVDGTGLACVWEMEVIDFERRAWLERVLKNDDLEGYLAERAPDTEL